MIKVDVISISIGYLIEKLENGSIEFYEEYARRDSQQYNDWTLEVKSQLIESILLGIPLPSLFFDEKNNLDWKVVNTGQIVMAIDDFIFATNAFDNSGLFGLDFLAQYEGYRFRDLPRDLARRIMTFNLTANIIRRETPLNIKRVLINRIKSQYDY